MSEEEKPEKICFFCEKPKPSQQMEETPDGENICIDCLQFEIEF